VVDDGARGPGTVAVRVHVLDEDGKATEGHVLRPRRGQVVVCRGPVEPDALALDVDLAVDHLTVAAAVQGTDVEAKGVDEENVRGLDVGVDEDGCDAWRGRHRSPPSGGHGGRRRSRRPYDPS